ncbi:hypothetical protein MPER_07473 [Moniliophthora perniciosa FA553]|nr:hypothetical protein MPER_07473 [Moniliophthora perniciosa FA553]
MQSRLSISLLSALLLLFTQLATALPSPAAREVEARAADVEARGWNYGDKELGYGNNRWGHDDDHKWDHHDDNEFDYHHEHSAWDVLLQVQVDISVEIDAIKSYQELTYDDCSKHVTIIKRHITRIHETIRAKSDAGYSWDDIFDRHDSEEIHAQIVIIVNIITELLNYCYSIGINIYINILADLCNDINVWLQLCARVVVGLSASLSVSVSAFVGLSTNLGVSISL